MYNFAENYITRRPSLDDAQAALGLIHTCEIAEYGEPDTSLDDLTDQWSGLDLNQDAWLVAAPGNRLVGYAAVLRRGNRFIFDWYAHPTLAPEGLTRVLITQCEERAVEKLSAEPGVEGMAEFVSSHDNPAKRRLADELGFRTNKYHFGMRIDLDVPPAIPSWPEGITLRTAVPGQDDRLIYDFIQTAFDRPGRVVPTFDTWRESMMNVHNFDCELWFLAYHGDELIGAALCLDYPLHETCQGWVRHLAVAQPWRRHGVGSALLLHVFGVFHERGRVTVGLGVDADNQQACRLYQNVGMECRHQYIEYNKSLSAS